MANAKRASMREGPLAALFRKNEEDDERTAETPAPARSAGSPSGPDAPGSQAPEAPESNAQQRPRRSSKSPSRHTLSSVTTCVI